MSGVLRPVRSYSLERRLSLWTPSVEPSRPRPRGVPPAPLGASPSSVPVFFVLLPAVSRCSSLSLLLLPVVFIPSRRNERLPRRDARAALPRPGCDPGPAVRRGPLVCSDRRTARWSVGDADPGPAHFARVRRMRLRSTTTTTGATTWRVGPSGMAPLPGWRRVLFRRDRRSVRRGPADGLRPASWSGTGPWPARVGGTGALRRNGDLFANSVRTCGRRGAGVLRPGVSTYSLPYRSPPRGPCSFPRRFREARWNRRSEGGGSYVPAGTAKGSGSRDCASWPRRTEAIQPPPPHRRKVSPWICSRCSVPWTRTSIDLARARAAFVAGHGPQVVAERRARDRVSTRTRPAAGTRCRRVGQRQRRRAPHSRSSSARPNSWRHPARPGRYREPSPDTALAGRQSLFRNRPVAGRRGRTGALGAVAGTADAKACVRGAGGGVFAFSRGCLSLLSAPRLPLPWFVRIPRRFREARQNREVMDGIDAGAPDDRGCRPPSLPHRRQWVVIRKVHRYAVAVVLLRRRRASPSPQLDRTGSPERPDRPTAQRPPSPGTEGGPRGSIRPGRATWNRCSGRTACESGPFGSSGGSCTGWERGIAKPETDPVVWQHVDRPGHGSSTTWTTRTESGTGRATSAISPGNRTRSASAARA